MLSSIFLFPSIYILILPSHRKSGAGQVTFFDQGDGSKPDKVSANVPFLLEPSLCLRTTPEACSGLSHWEAELSDASRDPFACHLQPDQEPADCRSLPYPAEPCFRNKTALPWCPQTGPKTMEPADHGLKFLETRSQNKCFFCLSWWARIFYHRNGKLTRISTMVDSPWLQ